MDVFQLSQKYQILLLLDCPTTENNTYEKLSDNILNNLKQAAIIFSETEIPQKLQKTEDDRIKQNGSSSTTGNQFINQNVFSNYDTNLTWMLIGLFAGHPRKQVHIFSDQIELFKEKLSLNLNPEVNKLKQKIYLHSTKQAQDFNLEDALNPWMNFDNQETLSTFEQHQLRQILKKFIKQSVTSNPPNNLEKLVNIVENLVSAHMQTIERDKINVDLTFHFIRSMFLDNVLENNIIQNAILNNEITCKKDFERFTKIGNAERFQDIISKIKNEIKLQQQQQQQKLLEKQQQEEFKQEIKLDDNLIETQSPNVMQNVQSEIQVVKSAIQALIDQYLQLFHRARIYEVKKLSKLLKQIENYIKGYVMRKQTAPVNSIDKAQSEILSNHQRMIQANILRILARFQLIKLEDLNNKIGHDQDKVNILTKDVNLRTLKEENNDFIFDAETIDAIFQNPQLVFIQEKEKEKEREREKEREKEKEKDRLKEKEKAQDKQLIKGTDKQEQPLKISLQSLEQQDQQIEKIVNEIKKQHHFPKTLRELEKQIKVHIKQNFQSLEEQDEKVQLLMKRMEARGMLTQKQRTGESKEHAKDPKLKNISIVEQFKKEKADIHIVFETILKQQQSQSTATNHQ